MYTLEELKRKAEKLRIRKENADEMREIGRERAKLKKEIKNLSAPKRAEIKKKIAVGAKAGGLFALRTLKNIYNNLEENDRMERRKAARKKPVKKRKYVIVKVVKRRVRKRK